MIRKIKYKRHQIIIENTVIGNFVNAGSAREGCKPRKDLKKD